MDAYNIRLTNMVYQGGDDCIAIKPRSYNIFVQNVSIPKPSFPPSANRVQITCHGGNGIAIGSLGQYLEDSSVINVLVRDANILIHNNDMEDGAYIKTWVGALVPQNSYESDYLPRGGGWYFPFSSSLSSS
jgi:galacturan 1,4-alpha-galacturonidase